MHTASGAHWIRWRSMPASWSGRTVVVAESWWKWVTWIVPAAIFALLWRVRRTEPAFVAGSTIVVMTLAPVLGLLPFVHQTISTVCDRYFYLPMIGICIALAAYFARVRSRIPWVAAGVVLTIYAGVSMRQVGVWQDSFRLWNHTLEFNPRSEVAYLNLAGLELSLGDRDDAYKLLGRGFANHVPVDAWFLKRSEVDTVTVDRVHGASTWLNYDDAVDEDTLVLQINPNNVGAWLQLGRLMGPHRKNNPVVARAAFQKVLSLAPNPLDPNNVIARKGLELVNTPVAPPPTNAQ